MTILAIPINAKRLTRSISGLNALMLLVGLVITIGFSTNPASDLLSGALRFVPAVVYSVLAVLIVSQQPGHTIGWLFLVIGFALALAFFGGSVPEGGSIIRSEQIRGIYTWVGHLVWIPAFLFPMSLVLVFFPDGRLPSRRWRPIVVATIAGMTGFAASLAFRPWPWEAQGILDRYNPFGIAGSEGFFDVFVSLSLFLQGAGIIGSVVAVVVRFRRSQGIERIQMKWLVYAATIGVSSTVLTSLLASPIADFVFTSFPTLMAIVIGIAILRHRLFDIDIVIRRTLQYAVLTGILVMIYYAGVVLLQGAAAALTGQENSPIVIVVTTLGIAALFNPLRLRIRDLVDRRFFRAKYDGDRALAAFAAVTQDEVDMHLLTEALLEIVDESVQPEHISLWVK